MKPARAFGETKSKGGFVEAQAELARMVCPANDGAPQLERTLEVACEKKDSHLKWHEKPSLTPGEAWSFGTCWRALNNPPSRLLRRAPVHRHPHWRGAWAEMGRCGPRQPSANHQTCHHSRQRNDAEDQGESRTRLISPELYTALLNHKAMAHYTQPADYVFSSSSGRSTNPDLLRETLQSVLRDKLKITLGPREDGLHLLRHTSGSLVFQQTGSVKQAQAWLGHSSSRITMDTYVHLMKESQQGTAELVFARPEIPAVPQKGQN